MSGRIGRSLVRSLGAAILGTVVLELAQAIEPATSVAASAQPGTPPAVTPSVRFTDVAPRSTFQYTSNNDARGRKYFPQPMCGGIALADYDGDGILDVFLTNGGRLPELTRPDSSYWSCLLRGRGDGRFEDVTERAGLAGKALRRTGGLRARRLVYVSCNPTTLASDVAVLRDEVGYRLEWCTPVDMFPHTPHIETVSSLVLP